MTKTTWRSEIAKAMSEHEDPSMIIAAAPDLSVLDVEFENDYGHSSGPAFTAWTRDWVYFPMVYDGLESVGRAPRHPCGHACHHVGGQ